MMTMVSLRNAAFILLSLILIGVKGYGQKELLTDKQLRDSYDLWGVKIPAHAYLKIKAQFAADWVTYRVRTNPEYVGLNLSSACNPFKLVLGDTIDWRRYTMQYSVKEWPDSTYSKFDIQVLSGLGCYYLVEKKGNLFKKEMLYGVIYSDSVKALPDTIRANAFSKFYPNDERFLYYYDKEKDQLRAISGNVAWDALPFKCNLPQYYILTRLAQYCVRNVENYRAFLNGIRAANLSSDPLLVDKGHKYYVAEKSLLSEGRLLIRTSSAAYDSLEILFYTMNPSKTGDRSGKTMVEYRYSISPLVEKATERFPAVRKLSNDEMIGVLKSNMRLLVDFYVPEELE